MLRTTWSLVRTFSDRRRHKQLKNLPFAFMSKLWLEPELVDCLRRRREVAINPEQGTLPSMVNQTMPDCQ